MTLLKNLAIEKFRLVLFGFGFRRLVRLRSHGGARADQHEPVDDHTIAGFQALFDDPIISGARAKNDSARERLVPFAHGQDGLCALEFFHCALRNKQGILLFANLDANAPELSR